MSTPVRPVLAKLSRAAPSRSSGGKPSSSAAEQLTPSGSSTEKAPAAAVSKQHQADDQADDSLFEVDGCHAAKYESVERRSASPSRSSTPVKSSAAIVQPSTDSNCRSPPRTASAGKRKRSAGHDEASSKSAELIDLTSDEQQFVEYISDNDDSVMSVDDQHVPDSELSITVSDGTRGSHNVSAPADQLQRIDIASVLQSLERKQSNISLQTINELSKSIQHHLQTETITPKLLQQRQTTTAHAKAIINDLIPTLKTAMRSQTVRDVVGDSHADNITVEVFGSTATGLALPSSDVDICINGLPTPSLYNTSKSDRTAIFRKYLQPVASQLRRTNIVENVILLAHTKVPIIKYRHRFTKVEVDISIGLGTALESTEFLLRVQQQMPLVKPLVLVLKHLLYKLGLDQPYNGTMGSYMVSTLVIIYLQLHRQHERLLSYCPTPTGTTHPAIAHHLINLLHFYTQFPTDQYGFTISSADLTVSIVARPDLHAASNLLADNEQLKRLMYIQDPIDAQNNVARSCYKLHIVKGAFKVMLNKLEQSCPPRCTWMQALMHISVQDIDKCGATTPNKRRKLSSPTPVSTRETLQSLTVNVEQPAVLPVDASPPPLEPASPAAKPEQPAVHQVLQQSEDQLRSVAQSMAQSLTSVFRSESGSPSQSSSAHSSPTSRKLGSNKQPAMLPTPIILTLPQVKAFSTAQLMARKVDILNLLKQPKDTSQLRTKAEKRSVKKKVFMKANRKFEKLLVQARQSEARADSQSSQRESSEVIDLFDVPTSEDDDEVREINDEKSDVPESGINHNSDTSDSHNETHEQQDDEKSEPASHDTTSQRPKQYTASRLRKLSVLEFEDQAAQILRFLQSQHGQMLGKIRDLELDKLPPQQQLLHMYNKRKSSNRSANLRKALNKQVKEMAATDLHKQLADLTAQLTRMDTRYTPLFMVARNQQHKQQAINTRVAKDVEQSIQKQLDKLAQKAQQSLPPMLGDQRLTLAAIQRFDRDALHQHRKKVMKALRALNTEKLGSDKLEAWVQNQYQQLLDRARASKVAVAIGDEQKEDHIVIPTASQTAAHSQPAANAQLPKFGKQRLTMDVLQQLSYPALTKHNGKVLAALRMHDIATHGVAPAERAANVELQSRINQQYNELVERARDRSTNGGLESSDEEEYMDAGDAEKSDTDDDVQELELKTGEIARMINDTQPMKRRLRSNSAVKS